MMTDNTASMINNDNNLMLKDLTDIKRFATDLHEGWIITSQYNDNPHYIVACYSSKTQYAGHWVNDTTLLARGLVLKLTDAGTHLYKNTANNYRTTSIDDIVNMLDGAMIAARGMRKFFTIQAATSDWGAVKLVDDDENITVANNVNIDYNAPASVADKLDGALGIGTIIDGDYIINTKGSFRSDEAIHGNEIMHAKHNSTVFADFMMVNNLTGFTPLFEIITPNDFHVVQYGSMNDIVLLGLLHQRTGHWIPSALLDTDELTAHTNAADIVNRFKFITPDVYTAGTLHEALARPALDNHEGMVVTINNNDDFTQDMFKIKYPAFLMLQRLKNNTSGKALKELIRVMPADAIMNADSAVITERLMDNLPGDARAAAGPIISRLNDTAVSEYINPIRDTVNAALALYASAVSGIDLSDTTDTGRLFASRVNTANTTNAIRNVVYGLKRAVMNGTADSDASMMNAAVDIAKRVILK